VAWGEGGAAGGSGSGTSAAEAGGRRCCAGSVGLPAPVLRAGSELGWDGVASGVLGDGGGDARSCELGVLGWLAGGRRQGWG
jgi:hypothetical protein